MSFCCHNFFSGIFSPKFHENQTTMGIDFIGDLLVPIDNMISKSTAYFLQAPKHVEMAIDIISGVLKDEKSLEMSMKEACRLIEVIFHACRGKVDQLMELFLDMTMPLYSKVEGKSVRVMLIESAVNTIFYNPSLALALFEKKGWTKSVFEAWFACLPEMKRVYDKKLTVLALCAVLTVPVASLPALVQHALPNIIEQIIKIEKAHVTQFEIEKKEDELLAEDDQKEDEEEEDERELSDDEDDKGELNSLLQKVGEAADEESDDDLEDFEDDIMEDDYQSIIDNEDELAIMLNIFKGFITCTFLIYYRTFFERSLFQDVWSFVNGASNKCEGIGGISPKSFARTSPTKSKQIIR